MDVRIVPHRDYQLAIRDLERVVDKQAKWIAVSFVPYVNGYVLSKLSTPYCAKS
jgi:hypothetical protein